ncbi:MAG: hypothetical protein H6Q00_841 [Holophagaceae bacterium]|nr:hypothetical protein [Holophagaceae bacterium]
MKLFALLQGLRPEDQLGHHRAFEGLVVQGRLEDYRAVHYRTDGPPPKGHWPSLYAKVLNALGERPADILLLQYFHGDIDDPRPFIDEVRRLNAHTIVVVSCGDPFGRWFQRPPRSLVQAASVSDLTLLTSMGYMADILIGRGARNLVLMPNGLCQERFGGPLPERGSLDFDLVFIGSNNSGRNPFNPISCCGRKRREMIRVLEARYGKRFGLFGGGWDGHASWQGPIPFLEQINTARRSRIQIGGFPGSYAPYYTSNRFYTAMASGIPLLDFAVERVDRLAEPFVHWIPYGEIPSLVKAVDLALDRSSTELDEMGACARSYVLGRHTHVQRAEAMVGIAQGLVEARRRGHTLPPPKLRCFHENVDPELELPWAVRNWHG